MLGQVGGQRVLLLETLGRRTGQRRTTLVQYLADDETFVVVASNAGASHPPAWYLNLQAHPHAHVQAGARSIDIRAHGIPRHAPAPQAVWRVARPSAAPNARAARCGCGSVRGSG